ncbi:MAG: hypothetical protein LBD22_06580 [Spirochaetaceae bacterium]|jgi:hypothetical protein|nr:hypothetical protein [Spirochaetaceae bacterium]
MKKGLHVLFIFLVSGVFLAAVSAGPPVIQSITGQIDVKITPAAAWTRAVEGMKLGDGTLISAGFNSTAVILLDGAIVNIAPLSRSSILFEKDADGFERMSVIYAAASEKEKPALVPPPPIGIGENERVKIRPPATSPLTITAAHTQSSLEKAGFPLSPVLPRRRPIVIEVIWQ